jgi:hypothetical protein
MLVGARRCAVQAKPVIDVHPRADVALDEPDPVRVPVLERLRLPGVLDVLVHLPHDVGVVAVQGEFPLLVRVAELVPAVRGPVVPLAARSRIALGLWTVLAPGLQRRPVQRVAAAAISEPVQPALGQVVPRVRLDLDRHVLVVRLLALGRGEVGEPAVIGIGELLGARLGVGEDRFRNASLFRCRH